MIIYPDTDGWVVLDEGDTLVAGPFVTVREALECAEMNDLVIGNMDDVEEWLRPNEDV